MKLGLFGINFGPCANPELAARVARAAEDAGFESVWTGEHVVLPDPQAPPSPAAPQTPMLDPAVALAHLAAHTRRIRLATGIVILPQRNPLVLAKELASVDVVSSGRLIAGVAAGYLKAEFDALGIPFTEKGARASEAIEVLRALWTQDKPTFRGRYWSFSGIQAKPLPVQKPHPPIVVGGHSPGAFRRAVSHGNGWYGFALDLARAKQCIAGLETARKDVERPASLGQLEIGLTPAGALDRDAARRFEDLGVSRLVPVARGRTADELCAWVEQTARAVTA
ncbi:MAG TPA: TIGR03619 family F420-dependent LLM class oxidoreductase [Myxococcota bacterium]|nr:TIGR03619 family F420-dependent LLM class oxidoreductase [Myxococcota bacterium]